jgi:hypothetical protein
MKNGCGRPECRVSTGICGSLTFGTGELDFNGYWEHPCSLCQSHFYKTYPEFEDCFFLDDEEEGLLFDDDAVG